MCIYISSEVILANLLSFYSNKNKGVTSKDVEMFCERFKKALLTINNLESQFVFFDINPHSLDKAIWYNKEFRKFQGRYFSNKAININHFNSRFNPEIAFALENTARSL